MDIRYYKKEDHEILAKWWKDQKWDIIPHEILPDRGFIISDDKDDLCSGFVYVTNSPVYLLEWILGNPNVSKERRRKGLDALIKISGEYCKSKGAKYLFSSIKHEGLLSRMEKHGFFKTDTNMTNVLKGL